MHALAWYGSRALGYKKRYTVNELDLMGQGEVLLLYTDGLVDPFSMYTQKNLERAVSRARDGNAKEICEEILSDRAMNEQTDDLSIVVIKRCCNCTSFRASFIFMSC